MPKNTKYAGFWIRALAFLIDSFILGAIAYAIFGNQCPETGFCVSYHNWETIIPAAYVIGFWIWKSATPGKLLLKLKITNADNKPLTPKDAILRFVGYIPSAVVIFFGFIWIGLDPEKQGWHDKIAKTHVIKG